MLIDETETVELAARQACDALSDNIIRRLA
jgi:hypothetical protein